LAHISARIGNASDLRLLPPSTAITPQIKGALGQVEVLVFTSAPANWAVA
jgi:hypothetical protein